MRNSTFNPEQGVGRILMSSLGVTFMQDPSVSAATDGRGNGGKRTQMRDTSEVDSTGYRGI